MGEAEGGMIWENGIETCILSYVKQITSPGLMHETGCLGLVHWDGPEGWDGEGGGRVPCPPPGDLYDPGIEPGSSALQADALPSKSPGKSTRKPELKETHVPQCSSQHCL